MSEILLNHKAFWGLAKALKTEGAAPTPALKRLDKSMAFDDREKAECLADSTEHRCSDNPLYDLEHVRRVEEEVLRRVSHPPKDDLDPMTHDEVSKHIKGLKIRKSSGRDTISSKALKCCFAPLVALLIAIFNACKKNFYFSTAWKEAVVIGIPKPWKTRDLPASYRPISLLSALGKLFEKTLKTRLSDQLKGKGLIINERFGFRPHHSCPQQALRLVRRLNNAYSSMRPIRAGVPQSSTLSQLLYSAYVNDIPRPSTGVQLALFADDTVLYLRSNSIGNIFLRLQIAIDELTQWLHL
ncbi:Probable RNA-directed DNA polymerase from transposon BS [Eumeta japonica]|uniref:Probable RNA-directed DNA polymerase from transposon BS n=1 Tax=Eumeta variegata TaxID=151549 RepID=A0A4C1TEG3_EUMVA|nr:Probable RNA-directed DNA polymerase from transposon BS [Eumeta japonica]